MKPYKNKVPDFFTALHSPKSWCIYENSWQKEQQAVKESLFTLGNGYFCCRGILEEIPYDSIPGTYIAGLYDKLGSQVPELVNFPNPINFQIIAEGEKVGVQAMEVIAHKRVLDMKKGLLRRSTVFANARKDRFDYQSLRFISMADHHTGVMRVYFTPLDKGVDLDIKAFIDTSVSNSGVLTEGRKKHFVSKHIQSKASVDSLFIETMSKKTQVAYARTLEIRVGKRRLVTSKNVLRLRLKKNQTICFTTFFSIYDSKPVGKSRLKVQAVLKVRKSLASGFDTVLKAHIDAWSALWDKADIFIKGDKSLNSALRFNIYHLLIAASFTNPKVSIGARTLSGEGYRGHIFWDTEIFIVPFFIYSFPEVARNLLLYRYHTLDYARINAREKGYKGALFAWESAETGKDTTPDWHKNLAGQVIEVKTGKMEHHISADIAYAVWHYYRVSSDEDFLRNYGLEIIFETARFWASRVSINSKAKTIHIKSAIGPDEFHEDVNDNVYTNYLARWNLQQAVSLYKRYNVKDKPFLRKFSEKIKLSPKEVNSWESIARKIVILKKGDLFEEFAGYFRKKDVRVLSLDENFMPVVSAAILQKGFQQTQLVKQADVLMLFFLFPERFSQKIKKKNFLYYEKRTLHKSSLSVPIHAVLSWRMNFLVKGYRYFLFGLYSDLANFHRNTREGIHAASLGGVWSFIPFAVLGMRMRIEGIIYFKPKLPAGWGQLKMKLNYRDWLLALCLTSESLTIRPLSAGKQKVRVIVYKESFELEKKVTVVAAFRR